MAVPKSQPVEIHAHAMDNLRYIRGTMERAGSFTAVPGLGGVLMGSTALVTAWIATSPLGVDHWMTIWTIECAIGVPLRHVDHVVADAESGGKGAQLLGDEGWQGANDEGGQQHHLHDAGAEDRVASSERGRELLGRDRLASGVDVEAGHRMEHRADDEVLELREPVRARDRRDHAAVEDRHLGGVGRREQHVVVHARTIAPSDDQRYVITHRGR